MLERLPNQSYENCFRHEISSESAAETLAANYYRPQRSWAKAMFLQASVIMLTKGSASVHAGIPPPGRRPPGRRPPGKEAPPRKEAPTWDTVHERLVRILLECILVTV